MPNEFESERTRAPNGRSGGGMIVGWRRAAGVLLAAGATVAAALAMPVRLPEGGLGANPGALLPAAVSGPEEPEDLGAFLTSRRWGVSVEEKVEDEPPPPEEPRLHPDLARMGFVGLIETGDERAVLLESPEGGVARVAPGETLPDGRVLVSVTGNRLVLKGEGLPEEVLTLFPPVRSTPVEGGGSVGGDGERAEAAFVPAPAAGASR